MQTVEKQRWHGLDTLRSLAILCVMGYHFYWLLPPVFQCFGTFGWMGVDLFFVLSGYLIGRQLLAAYARGERPGLASFYRNRVYRILPAYLVVLALYFLLPVWREANGISPLWEFLTFTENLFVDYGRNQAFSHVWSLCVEEHFYLLLPLVLALLMRRPSLRKTALAAAGILLAGIAVRGWAWHNLRAMDPSADNFSTAYIERVYYPTWCRLDGLLDGVLLASVEVFRPAIWQRLRNHGHAALTVFAAAIGVSVWMFLGRFESASGAAAWSSFIGFPLMSFALAALLVSSISTNGWLARWKVPGAGIIAAGAYSLYLTHKAAVHLCRVWFPVATAGNTWRALAIFSVACVTSGAAMYFSVERPFLKLRERI